MRYRAATETRSLSRNVSRRCRRRRLVDLVFDTLAEYSVDAEMDTDWWAGFPMSVIQGTFESLVMSDMDADDRAAIEEFRGE